MRRELFKRVFFTCTCFLILLNMFTPISFAAINNLSGTPYSSSYIPVCQYYPLASNLPYGENTFCVCYERSSIIHDYYFFTSAYELLDNNGQSSTDFDNLGFFVGFGNTSDDWTLNIQSGSKIIHILEIVTSSGLASTREDLGTFTNISSGYDYPGYYSLVVTLDNPNNLSNKKIISNLPYCWNGFSGDQLLATGQFSSVSDFVRPYYIASYPDNVSAAIQSLDDYAALMTQYYNTLNSKLNSLSSDHIALYNQNQELQSQVSVLQSQVSSQGGEYQSALNQAQSEIESNANSAASNAASEVVNAGEDVSDLDNDVDNVSDIVDTLEGWIDSLDSFADHIDESTSGVATALDNGKTLFNGFLGVCPPIVIALFGFVLVFLVVRKIIGR